MVLVVGFLVYVRVKTSDSGHHHPSNIYEEVRPFPGRRTNSLRRWFERSGNLSQLTYGASTDTIVTEPRDVPPSYEESVYGSAQSSIPESYGEVNSVRSSQPPINRQFNQRHGRSEIQQRLAIILQNDLSNNIPLRHLTSSKVRARFSKAVVPQTPVFHFDRVMPSGSPVAVDDGKDEDGIYEEPSNTLSVRDAISRFERHPPPSTSVDSENHFELRY